ncbi:SGNH/GDSL hydrolase family protein [Bifidobacterium margollesii]|uniref:SGNH/GDSL hydrolase family protein n=1 Tax=Bifidobacterium margollesii TaxID=2020964 RepID=UPI001FAFA051|nr:GDSL-type esterase/lipase family protein [Bifidobacterium margollesii]
MALIEAVAARRTVHLASEPEGERWGTIRPSDSTATMASEPTRPLDMAVVGDSLTVGCGVERQSDGLVPDMARSLADVIDRPVHWRAYGRLGATMRRVRFRLLPQVEGQPDLLVLCAGSNDLMARRSEAEWREDLGAAIDEARTKCDHVVVISSGQVYRSPALGRTLRKAVLTMTDRQTAISRSICEGKRVQFVDMTHYDTGLRDDDFWAYDHFHPSRRCYGLLADGVIGQFEDGLLESLRKA